jgi:GNAT superfamily N-acetyltransferase
MAALTQLPEIRVRAPAPGEGSAVAALWRELWNAHEAWGGYPGSRDPSVYVQLASRLDDDAYVRAGNPTLGRHIHLVAEVGGVPSGQVEGWIERYGFHPSTASTCEVRSLFVSRLLRGRGVGGALLDGLARVARGAVQRGPCVLAAEVLAQNPANGFYDRRGYRAVAWSARIEASAGAAAVASGFSARMAAGRDRVGVVYLENLLAVHRARANDSRFDGPFSVDPAVVATLALKLDAESEASPRDPVTLVSLDREGTVQGIASFAVQALEPPFEQGTRALAGRFAVADPTLARPVVAALVSLACRMALSHGAPYVELTDLPVPGGDIYEAALALGARPWSRVVTRPA